MTATHSEQINELAAALAKAQGEMRNPPKDVTNTFFKSQYADLAGVRDAVIPSLSKHGLAVSQLLAEDTDGPVMVTMLIHSSGQWLKTAAKLRATKNDPQGIGSASTYARRYALQSIAGVAAEVDDDGNAGSDVGKAKANGKPANKPAEDQPDAELVKGIETQLKECTNLAELDTIAGLIKVQGDKLTEAGRNHLRSVYSTLKKKLPGTVREPGSEG